VRTYFVRQELRYPVTTELSSALAQVHLFNDLSTRTADIHAQVFQDNCCDTAAFFDQAKKNMLGTDLRLIQIFGFFCRKCQGSRCSWRIWDICSGSLSRHPGANQLFDFCAYSFKFNTQPAHHVWHDPRLRFEQSQKYMLGPDKIVIQARSFRTREFQCL